MEYGGRGGSPMGMVGCQNADSGMALVVGTDKLLLLERKCARGGEMSSELGLWELFCGNP